MEAPAMSEKREVSLKAVFLGLVVDIVGTVVVGLVLGALLGMYLISQGVAPDELSAQLEDPGYIVPGLVVGLSVTVLGGFIAGRVAGRSEVLHGGLVGMLGVVLGFPLMVFYPEWYDAVSLITIIPCGMLGGRLAALGRKTTEGSADEPRAREWNRLTADCVEMPLKQRPQWLRSAKL